jgi:hypothetical protein
MPDPKPIPVFLAPNLRVAGVLAEWLTEKGIAADVRAEMPKPTVDALTGATVMADPTGVEVVVLDPGQEEEAKQLLADRIAEVDELRARREARAAREGTVAAVCEECGKSSDWPASAMGSTQDCPHCTAFMDVPDPDDEWADLDVGADDEGEGG